ncbi:MAG: class I SAM-dependent methyltransferase [Planctomycetota bacterium]
MADPVAARTLPSCCAELYGLDLTRLLLGPSFHPGGGRLTRRLGREILLHRGSRVLDVASGGGASASLLARHFGCRTVGLDFSQKSLRGARTAAGPGSRPAWLRGEAGSLPVAAGAFDAVVCECALCTFPDLEAALGEMRRVLRPGGRVGISDMVLHAPVPEDLRGPFGRVLCIAGARTRQGYVEALRRAGFGGVRSADESRSLLELVDDVERRIGLVRELAARGPPDLPPDLDDAGPVLAAAADFIRSGGLGYALFSARRPR